MTSLLDLVLQSALLPERRGREGPEAEAAAKLEWAWGLGRRSLEAHLDLVDLEPELREVLECPTTVPIVEDKTMIQLRMAHQGYPTRIQPNIMELYNGDTFFNYTVICLELDTDTSPYAVVSNVPPHLTLGTSFQKLMQFRRAHKLNASSLLDRLLRLPGSVEMTAGKLARPLSFMEPVFRSWLYGYPPPEFVEGLPRAIPPPLPIPELPFRVPPPPLLTWSNEDSDDDSLDGTPPRRITSEERRCPLNPPLRRT
uniref:Uncharacterized protein n=1 Tax=Mycena chlorophos TaxID=658473 RepID=A0ABQ0KY20_MYCCL|nr:predicted protein [Mycena chlorophos]